MEVVPNNEVRLLNNVPLNNSYEHQLTFTDQSAQANYFTGKTSHSFTDFTYVREDGSIKVPMGRDGLYDCNYMMFKNTDFAGKWFYAFITKLEYVNPDTTKVHFELDAFQTWQFDYEFKPSFIEREHQPRWNNGLPVVNTLDEGLDYGSEYTTARVRRVLPFDDTVFLVIVAKERMDVNSDEIDPVVNGSIQPLTYYVHPFNIDGSVPFITVDGEAQTLSPVEDVLKALYTSTVAVNNIANLYITEYIGIPSLNFYLSEFEPVNVQDSEGNNFVTLRVKHMPEYYPKTIDLGSIYTGFTPVTESKLHMSPYILTLLSDMKGNVQEIKNEYVKDGNLSIVVTGSIGTSNKVSYRVKNYLVDEVTTLHGKTTALERAIINNNPNDVPIITDLLSAYLQGNRNTLQNQTNQILFSSLAGTIGSAFGAVGSAMARNPVGAISGIGQIGGNIVNSYFQLQGLVAKQKDLDATPPQLSNMGGNTAFDYGNDIRGLYIIQKEITPEYRNKLTDYFKMYGYRSNEVKVPNLKSRQHFNFIKTVGANLSGNVPQDDLIVIKRMFDNGVTLWHTPDVGNYSLSNSEVS